jgi:hypothetical protein
LAQLADGGEGVGTVFTKPTEPENHDKEGFFNFDGGGGWKLKGKGSRNKNNKAINLSLS